MAVRQDKVQVDVELNGKKAGDSINDLQKSYKQLNRERNQMTVGTDEYIKKTAELKKVNGRLTDLRKDVKGVDDANKGLVQRWMEILPFNGHFQKLNSTMSAGKGQVGSLAGGFKTLKGAIISTGIGALVVLVGTLITYLTSTQEGMDKVTAVTRPLSAIFQKLKGVLQKLGGSVFKGLAMIMKGDISEGLKAMGEGFSDAVDNTKNAVKEGWEAGTMLDQLQKKIEQTEINLTKRRAELNVEFEKSKEIAQDQAKSEEERMAAAKRAQSVQNELLQSEQELMDMKIKKIQEEQKLNNTSREDEKELAELIAQRTSFEADAAKKRASAKNLENSIQKQLNAEQEQLLQERAQKEEEILKDLEKKREDMRQAELAADQELQTLRLEVMDEGLEKEIAKLDLAHERKLEKLQGNEQQVTEQRALLEQEREEQLLAIREQWAEKEKERKLKEKEKDLEELALEDEFDLLRLQEKFANTLLAESEFEEAKYELKKTALERELEMMAEFHGMESQEYKRASLALLRAEQDHQKASADAEKKAQQQKLKIQQAGYQGAKDIVALGLELLDEEEEGKKEQNKAYRVLASMNVGIGLSEEIQSIWKNANANPMNALVPGWGAAMAIVQTASAAARAGKAIGKISTAKYAKGGIFGGSRHAAGGNMVIDSTTGQPIAEVESGEPYMIFSRNTYANNKPVIDQLLHSSMHKNGAPIFENGGIMNPYRSEAKVQAANPTDTATIANQAQESQQPETAGNELNLQILAELRRMNVAIEQWPRVIRALVVLNDLQAAQEEMDAVEDDARMR